MASKENALLENRAQKKSDNNANAIEPFYMIFILYTIFHLDSRFDLEMMTMMYTDPTFLRERERERYD